MCCVLQQDNPRARRRGQHTRARHLIAGCTDHIKVQSVVVQSICNESRPGGFTPHKGGPAPSDRYVWRPARPRGARGLRRSKPTAPRPDRAEAQALRRLQDEGRQDGPAQQTRPRLGEDASSGTRRHRRTVLCVGKLTNLAGLLVTDRSGAASAALDMPTFDEVLRPHLPPLRDLRHPNCPAVSTSRPSRVRAPRHPGDTNSLVTASDGMRVAFQNWSSAPRVPSQQDRCGQGRPGHRTTNGDAQGITGWGAGRPDPDEALRSPACQATSC
jgi:hypothetical protein